MALKEKVVFLMVKAKKWIKDAGLEFSPETNEIKLLFRGKVLGEEYQLGNYLTKNDII